MPGGIGYIQALRDSELVKLVKVDTESGGLHTMAEIFDESFTGQIVGGISALTPGNTHYMLLAQSRLLAVDLETHVVSYFGPFSAGWSGTWAFLEISRFYEPWEEFSQIKASRDDASMMQRPLDMSELRISVLGLESSLPVKRGSETSNNFFSVEFRGEDVGSEPGHRIQVSPAGDCGTVLPGGGPFEVMKPLSHTQRFFLELEDAAPAFAQFCYSRSDGFDASFRPLPYGGEPASPLVAFPTTMAFFSIDFAPIPVGTAIPLALMGALTAGDTFHIVVIDGSVHIADVCTRAALYPGTDPIAIVTINLRQTRAYEFGAVTEIAADLLLESAGGADLAVCYRRAGAASFSLIRGRQRSSPSETWQHSVSMTVAVGDPGSGLGSTCNIGALDGLESGMKNFSHT